VSSIHFAATLLRVALGLGTLLFSSAFLTSTKCITTPYTSSTTSTRAILSPQASSSHAFSRRTASLLFICHYYNPSKAQSLPRVRRCWLRKLSPVYIDYFCLYCISGLPAGHIISQCLRLCGSIWRTSFPSLNLCPRVSSYANPHSHYA